MPAAASSKNGVILVSFSFTSQYGHFMVQGEEKCMTSLTVMGFVHCGQEMKGSIFPFSFLYKMQLFVVIETAFAPP